MSDICYCGNRECKNRKCKRHWNRTKKLGDVWITYAFFKGNEVMCPLEREKRGVINDEKKHK